MSSMDSEQFFLKWNNFESNLASGFADLLQREAMVDVTLAAEGKIVQAHKIILSICSSYFRNMFQVNPCQHPIVVLKDVRYQELTDMLDFMYKGEANVRQEDLPSFLKLAETLRVKGLAGNQGELDEKCLKKNSESQISSLTKDSSPFKREEPSNEFLEKVTVARKKAKSCSSPLVYTEAKDLPHPPNIKLEMEECDNNFVRINENNCGQNIAMKEERLSDNSVDSYGENHVGHENLEIEKIAGPSTLDENSDAVPQETLQHTKNFSFLESCFGGHLLILGGYTYRRKSMTPEKSYWFCCSAKCPAKGILRADGEFQVTHSEHNHKPDFEKIKRKERLVELKKLALQMNVSGQELLQALDIKDDVKKHLGFIRTCRRRDRKRNKLLISTQTPLYVGLNYKRLPSRISSKEMLFHSGYLFRQDSRNPQNEKCKYWRCRVKKCRARAKTDELGNLTILKPLHNHSVEENEETLKCFRQMMKTESSASPKPVGETNNEHNVKKDKLKTFYWKVRKDTEKQKEEKFKKSKESSSATEDANSVFSTTDSEAFSFEKLMAETLGENYCVNSEFSGSINILRSSENPR